MTDKNLLTEKPLTITYPLVANPELITVRTIGRKIVEQLEWFDGRPGMTRKPDMTGVEIVGEAGGVLVVRKPDGSLARMSGTSLLEDMIGKGMTSAAANEAFRAMSIPQLFEV